MRKYFLFCVFIPICLLLFLNLFFFNVNAETMLKIMIWMFMFQWSAYLLHPWFLCLLKDRACLLLGTQRILFLVIFTYIIWIIPQLNIFFFSPGFVWSVFIFFILLALIGHYFVSKMQIPIFNKTTLKEIFIQEVLFQYIFIVFLVLHSLYPDSSWGEKSMDLSLLSYLIRRDYFPIFDNWSPEVVMKYYYWGYYCYAGFLKMLNFSNTIGYTVVAATLPALMVTALYSLFRWASKSRLIGIGGAIFLVCSSNWAAFYLHLINFPKDHFWFSARVFESELFAEFPFWSFIFKDLHPHVFTYPLTIALLSCLFLVNDPYIKSKKMLQGVFYLILSILWGALIGFNGWDFLIYSVVIILFVLLDKQIYINYQLLFFLLLLFGLMIVSYLPMLQMLRTGGSIDFGFVWEQLNHFGNYYLYLGNWINIISLIMLFLFFYNYKQRISFRLNIWMAFPITLVTVIFFQIISKKMISVDVSLFCLIAMLIINVLWALRGKLPYHATFSFKLLLVALMFIFLAEHFYFMDRINTIFKTLNNVWIWLAMTAVILLRLPVRIMKSQWKIKNFKYLGWSFLLLIFILTGVAGSIQLGGAFYKLGDQFSLDPLTAYLKWDKGALETINWINNRAPRSS